MQQVSNKILYPLDFPIRYIFGRDIFISYSRRDTFDYPENLVLALQKRIAVLDNERSRTKLSYYLDKWNAPPDDQLPASLIRHLRWSSMLVVICTEKAVNSPSVRHEIGTFPAQSRKVILVNVDNALSTVDFTQAPWNRVSGAAPLNESVVAVKNSEPSDHVIERVLENIKITTQYKRLRRSVWGTLVTVILLLGLAAVFSIAVVQNAKADAKARVQAANEEVNKATTEAERITEEAERRVADAKSMENYAIANAWRATTLTVRATRVANEQRQKAQQASQLAQQRSKKQRLRGLVALLANRSQ